MEQKFTKFMANFCLCSIKKPLPKMEQKFTKFMANITFFLLGYILGFPAGLFLPGTSRDLPRMGQDLETLKVPWSRGPGTK
jgi:hypothetical protein